MGTLLHASSLSVPRGLCCTFMHVQSSGETGRGSEALWFSAGSWRDLLLCFLNARYRTFGLPGCFTNLHLARI